MRHFAIRGQGDVLFALSSLGTTSEMFEPQLAVLSQRFQVIVVEHEGHLGKADDIGDYEPSIDRFADEVVAVADQLGIERFDVMGLSLGGMMALSLAHRYRERVAKLVVACSAPVLPPAQAWIERARLVRLEGTQAIVDGLIERWFPASFVGVAPDVVSNVRRMVLATNPEGYARACEAIASFDATDVLGEIEASTLVIAGRLDPVVQPEVAVRYAAMMPNSRVGILDGSAHLANLTEPDEFLELVLSHLVGPPA